MTDTNTWPRWRSSSKLTTAINFGEQIGKRIILNALGIKMGGKIPPRMESNAEACLVRAAATMALAQRDGHAPIDLVEEVYARLKAWNEKRQHPTDDPWVTLERRDTYEPYHTTGPDFLPVTAIAEHVRFIERTAFEREKPCVYAGRQGDRVTVGTWHSHDVVTLEFSDEQAVHDFLFEAGCTKLLAAWIEQLAKNDTYEANRRRPFQPRL